jgi:hypothetical protein
MTSMKNGAVFMHTASIAGNAHRNYMRGNTPRTAAVGHGAARVPPRERPRKTRNTRKGWLKENARVR